MEIQSTNSLENTNLETTKAVTRSVELLCPKCKQRIPSIEEIMMSSKKTAMVRLNCQCLASNKIETVELGEYLHYLSLLDHNQYVCFKHTERLASVFCKNCALHLCPECRSYHKAFTPSHVTFVHEEKSEASSSYCFTHSSCPLDLYCEDCNDNLCIECVRRFHFNHKVMKLKEYWGRVYDKFGNKSHEEITAFMTSQIASLDAFIQKEVDRINGLVYTLQQLKTKLEHKVKHALKTNKTIALFISCIFSDFYKGEYCPNYTIIQNIERVMFEELLSMEEKTIITKQFSVIEEAVTKLFHYDKECLSKTIAKVLPRRSTIQAIPVKISRTPSLGSVTPMQGNTPPISTIYWPSKEVRKERKAETESKPVQVQMKKVDLEKKIINKEEILKTLNIGLNDSLPIASTTTAALQEPFLLQHKTKRSSNERNDSLDRLEYKSMSKTARSDSNNNIIKLSLKNTQSNPSVEYFKIGKEKKLNKQPKLPMRKEQKKPLLTEQPMPIPNANETKAQALFDCTQSVSVISPEIETKEKAEPIAKECIIDFSKEKLLFSPFDDTSRENDFNFFHKGFEDFSPMLQSQNMFSEVKVLSNNQFEQCVATITEHKSPIKAIAQLSNGNLVSAGCDNIINVFNSEGGYECLTRIATNDNEIYCLLDLFDGNIAVGLGDNSIKLYDSAYGTCSMILIGHSKPVSHLSQKDVDTLLSAGEDCTVKMWDLNTKKCLFTYNGHSAAVTCVLGFNQQMMVSVSKDMTLRLWKFSESQSTYSIKAHSAPITMVIKLFDDNQVATASCDKTAKVWDIEQKTCIGTLKGHTDQVSGIIQLTDGSLASVSFDTTMRIWDLRSFSCINSIIISCKSVTSLIQLSNGSIATGAADCFIKLWV